MQRYETAYPGVFDDIDPVVARRSVIILGSTADGTLWPRQDLVDLLDRMNGRITFEQYRARGRHTVNA